MEAEEQREHEREAGEMRGALSFMAVMLVAVTAAKAMAFDAAMQGQVPASQESAIRQKLSQIPVGSSIEVRLTNNEKLKGKLGGVSDEGIILKQAKGSQIEERKIAFAEMKFIKTASRTGEMIVLCVGVGICVFVIYLFA
jgi:small nuclear ribonucleoprotein (snRNP)-like protein